MQNLTRSLRSLPPKQVLALALVEKAKREKKRKALLAQVAQDVVNSEIDAPPVPRSVSSVVLDDTHPASDLLRKGRLCAGPQAESVRYKIYWGGRGGVKSWAMAEALVRLAAAKNIRILCCREFQNSIKDSSHKLLKDTIERLGLTNWFTITADSIRSRVGAEFIFKGLHNNENSIRSMAGVNICWVEEAHSVTALSWQSLLPTIRDDDSEIWISFNMVDESDATYSMFVANPRPRSIIHHINYDSNPFFPEVLREEMEHDKKTDYALYEHIWLGKPRKRSNAIVLNGKYRVAEFPDDLYEQADRLFFGADWGYAEDPSTLVRTFIIGNTLYIEYEAYGKHIELNDYKQFYEQVPGSEDWPIYADSALPATISHVRGLGFAIDAAEKWPGSVEDGIKFLRGFDEIVIHPRCKMAADEAYRWRYKVDKKVLDANMQPLVLPVLVDAHNHIWDAVRYAYHGYIPRSGEMGVWNRLGAQALGQS